GGFRVEHQERRGPIHRVAGDASSGRAGTVNISRSVIRRAAASVVAVAALLVLAAVWEVARPPRAAARSPLLVNDVSQLNPIAVTQVVIPRTTQEIVDAVTHANGPISIGGARHSMGGQIGAAGGLHIDLRHFDRILAFSPADKAITVQAGVCWRQIQERIDPANLSAAIMQSYAYFTVGGSPFVNAPCRY